MKSYLLNQRFAMLAQEEKAMQYPLDGIQAIIKGLRQEYREGTVVSHRDFESEATIEGLVGDYAPANIPREIETILAGLSDFSSEAVERLWKLSRKFQTFIPDNQMLICKMVETFLLEKKHLGFREPELIVMGDAFARIAVLSTVPQPIQTLWLHQNKEFLEQITFSKAASYIRIVKNRSKDGWQERVRYW